MNETARNVAAGSESARSVYYAQSQLACTVEQAWPRMLAYQDWNPGFVGGTVSRLRGQPASEGELVLISLVDAAGNPVPEFYAETLKVVPLRHIVWDVYPKAGEAFRNFLDFELTPAAHDRAEFRIHCYTQDRLTGALLEQQRAQSQAGLNALATAFREHCQELI